MSQSANPDLGPTPSRDRAAHPVVGQAPPVCAASARWLGLAVALLGMVVFVGGWLWDIAALRTVSPSLEAGLSRTTAIAFVVLGVAVALMQTQRHERARKFGLGAASAVALVAAADLAALGAGVEGGFEYLIFPNTPPRPHIYMSAATAVNFLLASVSLALLATRAARGRRLFSVCSTFGLATALVALTGYAYDASALYSVPLFTAMAVHTAGGFLVLFSALLCSAPEWSWAGVVAGDGQGSKATRRLLPAIVSMPFLLGWLALLAIRQEVLSLAFNLSLVAIVTVSSLSALLIRSARLQNKADEALHHTNRSLQQTARHRDLLLREVYHRTKNNMQLVDSMLTMESMQLQGADARAAIERSSKRVQSLALIHQMLIEDSDTAAVDLGPFLTRLGRHLQGADLNGVEVLVHADPDCLSIERAIPIGLIANELITNALQHAFPRQAAQARIELSYRILSRDEAELSVFDNGTGNVEMFQSGEQGVGWRIVRSLVNQLAGKMVVNGNAGTTISVRMPRPGPSEQ